jgi:NAD(P)-dependent dehydrogenase (short-subunit alcohol dehydrogenase family)
MATEKPAKLSTLIRGILANPTGKDDISYDRVILKTAADNTVLDKKTPVLSIDSIDTAKPVDELRAQIAEKVNEYLKTNGAKPQVVSVKNTGVYHVEKPVVAGLPLTNEVAIVTGAAGAIGTGICKGLLEKGCYVAATDLPGDNLTRLVDELNKTAPGRVIGVGMDVTNQTSIESAFDEISRTWGGVDIFVANAGIPLAVALTEMKLEDFQRLEKVNVEGTLLTISEAGRHMRMQGTGGDIVLVSTKNVFSPGAGFGAYSATKAAAHQIARIASLEFAGFDVRVNMVAPDAVFSEGKTKSGLWEKIGPDRMKQRGITDEKELHEYYRSRNLLKAKITAQHVANAVLFFVMRQTPTTGATIPVDGGLPDATPR